MKKIISMLLISTMLVSSLTACDNNKGGSSEVSEPEGADNSGLPFPENKAGELAKAALATGNWPAMDIAEPEFIPNVFPSLDLNLEICEEYCLATNIISAQLYKVIVVKPSADSEDDVRKALDDYLNAVKTDPNIAFYPGQQACADGAVSNKTDDGYLCVIVHENGADIANAMTAG